MTHAIRIGAAFAALALTIGFPPSVAAQTQVPVAPTPAQQSSIAEQNTLQIQPVVPTPLSAQGGAACSQLTRFSVPGVAVDPATAMTRTIVQIPLGTSLSLKPGNDIGNATMRAEDAEACSRI